MLEKPDPTVPALVVTGRDSIAIRAGVAFAGRLFAEETPVLLSTGGYVPGADYAVAIDTDGTPRAVCLGAPPTDPSILGGFHFAPGGNAPARAGGDAIPAINPHSAWDINFRPTCPDPRGMTFVEMPGKQFWCDIYLLTADHLTYGTSAYNATIADGDDLPQKLGGGRHKQFDYTTAREVTAHHGKGLLSVDEFFAAAYGVTEETTYDSDPKTTHCDPARTSKWGAMQATGNMWVWGHDDDPDTPRASLFGGSWVIDGSAGSRHASVACYWPDSSDGAVGARGRSDHLQIG